jgi:uncharacterized protein YqhQ
MPEAEYLQLGGQAIVEGVMMRSPKHWAVACRAPNGKIVVRTHPLEKAWLFRQKWLKLPFLRGTLALLDGMYLGIKAMKDASNIQIEDKYQTDETRAELQAARDAMPDTAMGRLGKRIEAWMEANPNLAIIISMAVGIGGGFLFFNILPNFVAQLIGVGAKDSRGTLTNYIAETIKFIFFIVYLWLIAKLPAIREVFKYHGAEHKAITTLENEEPLTMEACQRQTRLHQRCGTSFAVIVFIVSFFFLPLVPRYPITGKPGAILVDVPVRVLIELCILPLIAGVSYELLRIAGKNRKARWAEIAFAPGLASQKYLTTVEPEDTHVEVALASIKVVVHADKTGELIESDDYDALPIAQQPATA